MHSSGPERSVESRTRWTFEKGDIERSMQSLIGRRTGRVGKEGSFTNRFTYRPSFGGFHTQKNVASLERLP
jgi:hypothetical protein